MDFFLLLLLIGICSGSSKTDPSKPAEKDACMTFLWGAFVIFFAIALACSVLGGLWDAGTAIYKGVFGDKALIQQQAKDKEMKAIEAQERQGRDREVESLRHPDSEAESFRTKIERFVIANRDNLLFPYDVKSLGNRIVKGEIELLVKRVSPDALSFGHADPEMGYMPDLYYVISVGLVTTSRDVFEFLRTPPDPIPEEYRPFVEIVIGHVGQVPTNRKVNWSFEKKNDEVVRITATSVAYHSDGWPSSIQNQYWIYNTRLQILTYDMTMPSSLEERALIDGYAWGADRAMATGRW